MKAKLVACQFTTLIGIRKSDDEKTFAVNFASTSFLRSMQGSGMKMLNITNLRPRGFSVPTVKNVIPISMP
jgi:hypothetical protein